MHPMMQAFREAQRAESGADLALATPTRATAPERTGVTRRDVLAAGGLVVAVGAWLPKTASAAAQGREGGAAAAAFEPSAWTRRPSATAPPPTPAT